ncbi:ABC transporter permease [Bosea thiooxidans]|nr:ABC transporter permease [Bosea sp. (in: a-proteobacteria)]
MRWLGKLCIASIYTALLAPVVLVIGASLTSGDYLQFPPNGLSLRWYEAMLNDREMVGGLKISLLVAVATVALSVPIGALGAIYIDTLPRSRRAVVASLFLTPISVPLVLTGFALLVLFTKLELLNLSGLIIGHTVIAVPYVLRTALASLSLNDPAVPRAAAILGARPWKVLWHVTLPLLRPGLVSGGLFSLLTSFNNVATSVFIAAPGDNPLPVVIFSRMDNLGEPSIAAASATTIILTALTCLLLEKRYALFRSLGG